MTLQERLRDISTAALAAEVARRLEGTAGTGDGGKQAVAVPAAAEAAAVPSVSKRRWYPSKTIWAAEMAKEARAVLEKMETEPVPPAGPKASRHLQQMNDLRDQIRGWERKAKHFAQKGL